MSTKLNRNQNLEAFTNNKLTDSENVLFYVFQLMGKFGERQNKPQTHCITQPHELFQLLDDPAYIINNIQICSEDVMEIVTRTAEEEYQRSFKTNVFIAAFTTSLARLKLYDALDFLGDRALYYDTDSVIYKTKPGQEKLPLSPFLGDTLNHNQNLEVRTCFVIKTCLSLMICLFLH